MTTHNRTWNLHPNHPGYSKILARRAQEAADAEIRRQDARIGIALSKCFDRYRTADRVNNERAERMSERRAALNRRVQARMDALHAIEMSRGTSTDATAIRIWTPLELAAIVCRRHGTSIEHLTERNAMGCFYRDEERIELRRRVWMDMAAGGVAYAEIARVFGTSHSSIIAACKRGTRKNLEVSLTRTHNGA